ncbi:hypothetical protein IWQ60_003132 [Tieghemiomyces parasiticus]|uniref:Membrane protein BRI3 n=1 Tax=Tieghemiomyces parasiticus TaxID=78921 RepID=A0A9W8AI00_9FUNG|nr:hypothetical protein IWQ60_003132 [Tieghemiomyces parasiticus]
MGAMESHERQALVPAGSLGPRRTPHQPTPFTVTRPESAESLPCPPPPPYSDSYLPVPADEASDFPAPSSHYPGRPVDDRSSAGTVGWKYGSPPPTGYGASVEYFPGMGRASASHAEAFLPHHYSHAGPSTSADIAPDLQPHSPYIQNPHLAMPTNYGAVSPHDLTASPLPGGAAPAPAYQVIYVQNYVVCPKGGDHQLETEFTVPGVLCALLCFPCGIPCCLCSTERRCVKCGARFD